jgi:hypothetical protein
MTLQTERSQTSVVRASSDSRKLHDLFSRQLWRLSCQIYELLSRQQLSRLLFPARLISLR